MVADSAGFGRGVHRGALRGWSVCVLVISRVADGLQTTKRISN